MNVERIVESIGLRADRRFYVDNEAAVLLADVSALVYRHFLGREDVLPS